MDTGTEVGFCDTGGSMSKSSVSKGESYKPNLKSDCKIEMNDEMLKMLECLTFMLRAFLEELMRKMKL